MKFDTHVLKMWNVEIRSNDHSSLRARALLEIVLIKLGRIFEMVFVYSVLFGRYSYPNRIPNLGLLFDSGYRIPNT